MSKCYICKSNIDTDIPDTDLDTGYAICNSCYTEEVENKLKIYELSK